MIKCTILIPTTYNDGRPVSAALLADFRRQVAGVCGGYTDAGLVTGAREGLCNLPVVCERNIELWAVCDECLLDRLRFLAATIARELEQQSVHLEWHEVNVEFVKPLLPVEATR